MMMRLWLRSCGVACGGPGSWISMRCWPRCLSQRHGTVRSVCPRPSRPSLAATLLRRRATRLVPSVVRPLFPPAMRPPLPAKPRPRTRLPIRAPHPLRTARPGRRPSPIGILLANPPRPPLARFPPPSRPPRFPPPSRPARFPLPSRPARFPLLVLRLLWMRIRARRLSRTRIRRVLLIRWTPSSPRCLRRSRSAGGSQCRWRRWRGGLQSRFRSALTWLRGWPLVRRGWRTVL